MTIIIYLRDLIVSLLSNLGLPNNATIELADVSLVAIGIGLLIAAPELVIIAILAIVMVLYLKL
jgi:hypothetical protein